MNGSALLSEIRDAAMYVEDIAAAPQQLIRRAPAISRWSVADHCQHLAQANGLSLGAVLTILDGTDGRLVRAGKPTLAGRAILRAGHIPRGSAEAPEGTLPKGSVSQDDLARGLRTVRARVDAITARASEIGSATLRFPHPMLGPFALRDWLRFTAVHTQHHLAIVDDILAAR
jgi:hypothetical protein